jgi:hypothetical protein
MLMGSINHSWSVSVISVFRSLSVSLVDIVVNGYKSIVNYVFFIKALLYLLSLPRYIVKILVVVIWCIWSKYS